MVEELFKNVLAGNDVRQNLSKIRAEIKNIEEKKRMENLIESDNIKQVLDLLYEEDAKTRKNAALLMGDLELDGLFLHPLFKAYQAETQMFVKSSYLVALSHLDYSMLMPQLKDRLVQLENETHAQEDLKHIREEMKILSEMILAKEGMKSHKFSGYHENSEIILLTNRLHAEDVLEELKENPYIDTSYAKAFLAGIQMKTSDIDELLPLRTYQELLFLVPGMKEVSMNPQEAGNAIAESSLMEFLRKRHQGNPPFYFRLECKTKMPLDKKTKFAKALAGEIEKGTERKLINSTDHYEIELRLIETKEGNFRILVKLHTILDERFSYRKESIAASIKPVNAALLVSLARPYMIEDAQVLDPFCGVGTMLIERQMQVKANTSYGIDIYNEAIEKARANTEAAGQIIHYVNKDFFEFEHEYLFDEIFTNMPFVAGHKSEDEIYEIYTRFFSKAKQLLRPEGTIIMYTHNREWVVKLATKSGLRILKQIPIMQREGTDLCILK